MVIARPPLQRSLLGRVPREEISLQKKKKKRVTEDPEGQLAHGPISIQNLLFEMRKFNRKKKKDQSKLLHIKTEL